MDFLPAILGNLTGLVLFSCVIAGVVKIFQLSSDVRELKDVLLDIKRNTQNIGLDLPVPPPPGMPSEPLSPEALVRAIHAEGSFNDSVHIDPRSPAASSPAPSNPSSFSE